MGPPDKSRIIAGIASAAIEALILLALVTGLRVHLAGLGSSANLIDVAFTAPPPAPRARKPRAVPKQHHASASAGLRAGPAVTVVPRIPLSRPTLPLAPTAGSGQGSGLGSGGAGSGAGSGGSGTGPGDEGGSDAEWTGGKIGDADYPSRSAERGAQGTVRTEIAVGADGRVASCRVIRSSGDADLDETTCRLVQKRFRFRPATDAAGSPIADTVGYDQEWVLHRH